MRKTSVIWSLSKEQFQDLLDTSESIVDVLKKLGIDPYCGNHKTVHARVKSDGLSLDKLKSNRSVAAAKRLAVTKRLGDDEVFAVNRPYDRALLKKRILEHGWLEYKCAECGCGDCYNGKPLSLQLDHINGINDDNRIENLRFLCPNCHSQTPTFGKPGRKQYETVEAKKERIDLSRKFNPSKDELEQLVNVMPLTKIGRIYGVTDNAVRKRCKLLDIGWK